jgi:NAD(P)H-hydrate epimerase
MTPEVVLYTITQMAAADAATIERGTAGIELMERAGRAVADAVRARYAPRSVVILCGPGNNGGDGFVAARHLTAAGWPVRLALLGARDRLRGDAALAAAAWPGPVETLEPGVLDGAGLAIDALFGAGLARPIDGVARAALERLAALDLPVVAVDVPSGVDGDSGEVKGAACPATVTVTFHRAKPGHVLLPGRRLAGELVIADIGIDPALDRTLGIRAFLDRPQLWRAALPRRSVDGHKYRHGHALVLGGDAASSGAARLAARAALRAGAGLVTALCPPDALPVYAGQLTAVMVRALPDEAAFAAQLADARRNAILLGPGGGVGPALQARALAALAAGKRLVLDADALTSFAATPSTLFAAIRGDCLLTPHEGEFGRLFKIAGDKLARTRAAARQSGAVVLLKGGDSVIAAPDGRAAILADAPPTLATAGTGDVLAGIALGLLAQGMPLFEAAAAAAWLHGAAAARLGPGLIAEDLSEALPAVLADLLA